MPLTGGESDKFGNWYEGLWTVYSMCKILRNLADSICLEILGKEGEGVEFRLNIGSTREYHQVKRQTARQEAWTIRRLKAVLSTFGNKLSDPNVRCVFVSQDSSTSFRELTENSENTDSWYDFKAHYLSQGSRSDDLDELCGIWNCTDEQAYKFLKRCDIKTINEKTLRDMVDTTLEYLVQGKPGDVRRFLAEIAQKRLHHEFRGTELWNLLAREGFPPRDWSNDPNILTLARTVTGRYTGKLGAC